MSFASRLKLLVADSGKTQKEIAAEADLSEGALVNYLAGRFPKVEELQKLALYFKVTPDYLLGWDDAKHKVNTLTRVAAAFAEEFGGTEAEQQKHFEEFLLLIQGIRRTSEDLSRLMDQFEAKTRFIAMRANSANVSPKVKEAANKITAILAKKVKDKP